MKKKYFLSLMISTVFFYANINTPVFAIEDETEVSEQKSSQSVLRDNINKNILTPNTSPGFMNDTEQTRRYYQILEGSHRTHFRENIEIPKIKEEKLTLPARIEQDAATTHIDKLEISNSKIFSDSEMTEIKQLIENKDVTAEDINNFVKIINEQYAKKNIITARATLESLKDGILKIELMEAKIGKISVQGNKFNRKWFLKKQISSNPSDVLNIQKLENDLKIFNKNARSIKLSAKLQPGEEYGTTDIILNAEEKFPYHFSASWDSFGRETTGLLRGGLMVSTDSLFGFQDRLAAAINMSRSAISPFVDYSVPINRKGTRIGGSYMFGNSKITSGEYQNFDLTADTHVFSTYITHPLIESQKGSLSLKASANFKNSTADIGGFQYTNFKDYNIAVGLNGRYNFKNSLLFGSLTSTNGIIHDDMISDSMYFTKVNADGYYIHYLPKNIIATIRAGGQYTPQDIPFVEQYQIGGMSSIRGYSESLLLGTSSYFASLEMLFPLPFLPEEIKIPFKENATFRMRDAVKLAVFMDNGAVFHNNTNSKSTDFLSSVGAGIRVAFSKYLTARFYVGIPILNVKNYDQSSARLHFDIIASPF